MVLIAVALLKWFTTIAVEADFFPPDDQSELGPIPHELSPLFHLRDQFYQNCLTENIYNINFAKILPYIDPFTIEFTIISGILTDKFNAVHLMTASQLAAIACTFLCPIAAEYGIIYLVAARMALGLAHGLLFPSCYILMERWLVSTEKAFAQSCVAVGSNFGIVIIMPLTAWLCDNGFAGGWPSAFYVTAAVNILFIIIWIITMTLDPSANRWVSQSEKNFLDKMTSAKVVKSKITKTPWISMLTSLPLWSVMITRGINGPIYYAINTKIPIYMEMVLGYQLQGNGLINSLFYVAICSTQLISGPMARWVIGKKWFSRTVTRKIFESIALFGTALCLGIIPSLGNRPDVIIIVLIASMFCNGFTIGGDTPIVMEMAPHLVGTAFGFANTLGCASGFIAPVIIASIIDEQVHSQSLWNTTFYTFAGLQMIGAFSFLTFATTKPQPWGTVETPSKPKDKTEINSKSEDLYDISSKV
ncbi:putative inorganic phosphate cotransporter isoform X1 [Panonychus citri]|uniref:putative inorganic phosphate cotransporter isoform X1 n=1 Tax=Panonychus citri TaxID=50023 RepID=UPI002307B5EF|nr:putative inorganic phosphate cotransporter isoform X1 [Panonychus citri]